MEREARPDRLPAGSSIRVIEAGFIPAGTLEMLALVKAGTIPPSEIERRVIAQYRLLCVDHTQECRQTFAVASDPESHPLLLHCTSGKDRTGFAAALLLLALGVSRETVIEDYDLTNLFRRPVPHLFGPRRRGRSPRCCSPPSRNTSKPRSTGPRYSKGRLVSKMPALNDGSENFTQFRREHCRGNGLRRWLH